MKCLLIDHYDSFTYNVAQWLQSAGVTVEVCKWDVDYRQKIATQDFLVLSPGPGAPAEYLSSLELLKEQEGKCPVLGICLGMQLMLHLEGIAIQKQCHPIHGRVSIISLRNSILLEGLGDSTEVARYHSLGFEQSGSYDTIATFDKTIMGIEHTQKKFIGVQFHPESFLTKEYKQLAHNLVSWVREHQ